MPLTTSGEDVLDSMEKTYGSDKGKSVFYGSINKGKVGSSRWHRKKPRKVGPARMTYRSKV